MGYIPDSDVAKECRSETKLTKGKLKKTIIHALKSVIILHTWP